MQTELVRITVRITEEQREFLEKQAEQKRETGRKSDVSDQVRVAITHRQLALLPEPKRRTVLRALGVNPADYRDEGEAKELPLGEEGGGDV